MLLRSNCKFMDCAGKCKMQSEASLISKNVQTIETIRIELPVCIKSWPKFEQCSGNS